MMFVQPEISTELMQSALQGSPLSKEAMNAFITVLNNAQGFLHGTIFNRLRRQVERMQGRRLSLKYPEHRAQIGFYICWAELSVRGELPSGWEPLCLLGQEPARQVEQKTVETPKMEPQSTPEPTPESTAESELNGMEQTPLFRVFGSPTTLKELRDNYLLLQQHHHPDKVGSEEAEDRVAWLENAYYALRDNWEYCDPRDPNIPQSRIRTKMRKKLAYGDPKQWWYWV